MTQHTNANKPDNRPVLTNDRMHQDIVRGHFGTAPVTIRLILIMIAIFTVWEALA